MYPVYTKMTGHTRDMSPIRPCPQISRDIYTGKYNYRFGICVLCECIQWSVYYAGQQCDWLV